MNLTDEALMELLSRRFAQSRKAFADLSTVNRKLLEMNRRLEESESLKSNFLSNIRNEINNPLNVILGMSAQLASLPGSDEQVSAFASILCSEANALNFQLRNIFLAAELEAGEADPHFSHTDIVSLAGDVIESFRYGAAGKGVSIELVIACVAESLIMHTDAEKVQAIFSNLLANAVEFAPEGSKVTVVIDSDEKSGLLLAVQDSGKGMCEEDIKRIFDRFVQLEAGTTRSHRGHGLGLSITKALVDLLQGTITVESSPGEGSVFRVLLPAFPAAEEGDIFSEAGNLFVFDEMSEK